MVVVKVSGICRGLWSPIIGRVRAVHRKMTSKVAKILPGTPGTTAL